MKIWKFEKKPLDLVYCCKRVFKEYYKWTSDESYLWSFFCCYCKRVFRKKIHFTSLPLLPFELHLKIVKLKNFERELSAKILRISRKVSLKLFHPTRELWKANYYVGCCSKKNSTDFFWFRVSTFCWKSMVWNLPMVYSVQWNLDFSNPDLRDKV